MSVTAKVEFLNWQGWVFQNKMTIDKLSNLTNWKNTLSGTPAFTGSVLSIKMSRGRRGHLDMTAS